jgi:putative transposase
MDFMHHALYSGRPFRTLNLLDEGNREGLTIEGRYLASGDGRDPRLGSADRDLGRPEVSKLDNGSEITSALFTEWCAARDIG